MIDYSRDITIQYRVLFQYDPVVLTDALIPAVERSQFELEKMDSDDIDFYQSTGIITHKYDNIENITGVFRFTPRKIIAPLWPRPTQGNVIDPKMQILIPPMWPTAVEKFDTMAPTTLEKTDPASSSTVTTAVNETITHTVDESKDKIKSKTNKTKVKSMKRRSVNNYHLKENSGSVILKILDNEAKSRIEIKLGSDILFKKQKPKILSFLGKPIVNLQAEAKDQHVNMNLAKDTIISIMPNDSIVIDEFDGNSVADKEHADVKELIRSLISFDENNEENNEFPLYEDTSHNTILQNSTQSLSTIVATDSSIDIRNNSNISESISTVYIENSTDFDTMANSKINNTEFNKIIFEDEEPLNSESNHENDTMSINNAVTGNYTDVFTENENDLSVYR